MGDVPLRNERLVKLAMRTKCVRLSLHGILTLKLSALGVDGSNWKLHVVEVVVKDIDGVNVVDEDQSTAWGKGQQQIVERTLLHVIVNPDNLDGGE